ncbi:phage tail assembly chaperone [Gilliamella mensalis]|uniref:phage tail assembly chaperone n=1 Tax=Gilliamella mensalis TaxID=1908520 RepID=UPI000A158DD7|nr:putative phage tail assembly chaperone [Gilliamella mensalis]
MQNTDFIIDDVTYTFKQADFFKANKYLKKLTALLKGCFSLDGNKSGFDIGQLASNIGSEQFAEIEKFILDYVTAVDENGKKVLFQKPQESGEFFNNHRSHYYQVIIEGLKFHFLAFLPSGIASKLSTANLETVAETVI